MGRPPNAVATELIKEGVCQIKQDLSLQPFSRGKSVYTISIGLKMTNLRVLNRLLAQLVLEEILNAVHDGLGRLVLRARLD